MAKRKEETPTQPEATVQAAIPGTVVVINRSNSQIGISLLDGTHIEIGPKAGDHNRSRVIPKKLLPPHVRRMADAERPMIKIVDATTLGGDA